jgi:hypothetical protein
VAEGYPHPPLCVFERWLCESINESLVGVMWRGTLGGKGGANANPGASEESVWWTW